MTHTDKLFTVIEHVLIPLSDGRKLAARIWMPMIADGATIPAILEYLPYRKRDGTAPRDESTYPDFARAGYAGVRLDISGTGESDGNFDDEYSPRELADGVEVIEWIARQSWCSGSVGMMGISWGGFNSLQIAALRPPALKATISIGTTVDRYNDDIHYKNGCLLYSNFTWSGYMLCYASCCPDPALVGDRWQEMWKHRLETQPFPLETWLSHQRRDEYWQHGSICEDWDAIEIPTMVISGWGDGYINAPPSMAEHNNAPVCAINGPWIHKYPHFAWPRPRMDFIGEAIRWWDRWLKEVENGAGQLPAYRAYIQQNIVPGTERHDDPGHWVEEPCWPSVTITAQEFFLTDSHQLALTPAADSSLSICSPQNLGTACGEFFPQLPNNEMSGDQREDDAASVCFETEPLSKPLEILGQPSLGLNLSINKPAGNLAVRLLDVHPDGASHRVSLGVLNLCHRNSNACPEAMVPDQPQQILLNMNHCGYRFLAGHRIRLAISTSYWPFILPPPETVSATVNPGARTMLILPARPLDRGIAMAEPENPSPLPKYANHSPASNNRRVEHDTENNVTHYIVNNDTGEYEMPDHGLRTRHIREERWSISPDDPLSMTGNCCHTFIMSRGDWKASTVSESSMHCDQTNYYISASVTAFIGDDKFHQKDWSKSVARDFT